MHTSPPPQTCAPVTPSGRMEAFSDGVFAIAITLLILEIHVPQPHDGQAPHLAVALLRSWPGYLAYVVSFVTIGIYWVNHHYLLRLFRGTNHVMNLLNLLLLMMICFIPFPTAVLSEYMQTPGEQQFAVFLYIGSFFAPALAWLLIWLYANGRAKLTDPNLEPVFLRHLTYKYALSVPTYGVAFLLTWFDYRVGLLMCVILTCLYLFPSRPPQYIDGRPGPKPD